MFAEPELELHQLPTDIKVDGICYFLHREKCQIYKCEYHKKWNNLCQSYWLIYINQEEIRVFDDIYNYHVYDTYQAAMYNLKEHIIDTIEKYQHIIKEAKHAEKELERLNKFLLLF